MLAPVAFLDPAARGRFHCDSFASGKSLGQWATDSFGSCVDHHRRRPDGLCTAKVQAAVRYRMNSRVRRRSAHEVEIPHPLQPGGGEFDRSSAVEDRLQDIGCASGDCRSRNGDRRRHGEERHTHRMARANARPAPSELGYFFRNPSAYGLFHRGGLPPLPTYLAEPRFRPGLFFCGLHPSGVYPPPTLYCPHSPAIAVAGVSRTYSR